MRFLRNQQRIGNYRVGYSCNLPYVIINKMKRYIQQNKNWWLDGIIGIIPFLLYGLILVAKIPYSFSHFFVVYSAPLFLLVLALFYLSFRLSGRAQWVVGLSLTLMFFGLMLSFLWSSGYSNDKIIGGLVPSRDAIRYYDGAQTIQFGDLLTEASQQAAYRPLFSGLLSSLLLLVGGNLQWMIAILTGFVGVCCYLAAHGIRKILGTPAAAIFLLLLCFFIQPLIGYVYSELLGLACGCLGFLLIAASQYNHRILNLVVGLIVLVIGLTARAGAFLILPLLILWAGFALRRTGQRYSFQIASIAAGAVVFSYLLANTFISRILVAPDVGQLRTFAMAIYGQVVGGAGYNSAIRQLGVRDQNAILQATWLFFTTHPFSFVIGAAKAYRDFFFPQLGMFSFFSPGGANLFDMLLWVLGPVAVLWGVVISARKWKSGLHLLSLLGFAGVFLSIPFLPPIDGGNRFYASTVPFFYLPLAITVGEMFSKRFVPEGFAGAVKFSWALSGGVIVLTLFVPILVKYLNGQTASVTRTCPGGQVPYRTEISPASYIDLISHGSETCGRAPNVCLSDFVAQNEMNDPSDQAIYRAVMSKAKSSDVRFFTAYDAVSGDFVFFLAPLDRINKLADGVISGCAVETPLDRRPSIYEIQTVSVKH